jgi:hypothetical protein
MTGVRGAIGPIAPLDSNPQRSPLRLGRVARFGIVVGLAIASAMGGRIAYALFIDPSPAGGNTFSTARIFAGSWTTPAFDVGDASSGTEVDASSPLAFAGDGGTWATKAWSTSFSSSRYLDFDLNGPLPGGLAVSGATFDLNFASSAAGVTSCIYLEVRIQSTNTVVETFGSAGSPAGCVTGTSLQTVSTSIASAVASTDTADDLRVRVYADSSGGAASTIDLAVVTAASPYAAFTLYPVSWTDAADGTPIATRWALAGP